MHYKWTKTILRIFNNNYLGPFLSLRQSPTSLHFEHNVVSWARSPGLPPFCKKLKIQVITGVPGLHFLQVWAYLFHALPLLHSFLHLGQVNLPHKRKFSGISYDKMNGIFYTLWHLTPFFNGLQVGMPLALHLLHIFLFFFFFPDFPVKLLQVWPFSHL